MSLPGWNNYFCSLMKRPAIIPDPVLMLLSLLVVAGFQVYWLKNNYVREKRNLQIKTDIAFRETVLNLQASKLNLGEMPDSVYHRHFKILIDNAGLREREETRIIRKNDPGDEVVTMINSAGKAPLQPLPRGLTIISKVNRNQPPDSGLIRRKIDIPDPRKNNVLRLLYRVDSLQDTLKLSEIEAGFRRRLTREKALVPFTIQVTDSVADDPDELDFSNVVVGFAHPRTYKLELGNTFPFLLRKIASPIMFSIFLVGLTILAFWILYRSLLRQRRLALIKNEFISNITHELKTPISTVAVAIEALRNFDAGHDPAKRKEYLDISAAELQRLSLLVDKVLKLSLFENKTVELKKEVVDMRSLVNEVMQMMKLQFEKSHARTEVKTSGDHFIIEGDKLHLAGVLYNLLDNALKFTPSNPVITIELLTFTPGNLRLKISDNGPGIEKEYQTKVFGKFFRVPQHGAHNIKGYGLGLSYVMEIVLSHRGNIVIESEVGAGSTFIITLPLMNGENAFAAAQSGR